MWESRLNRHCLIEGSGVIDPQDSRLCGGMHSCSSGRVCARSGPTPDFGVTSFDNFLWATLTVFVSITLEG
jgi:hypothetical protein